MSIFLNKFMLKDKWKKFRHDFLSTVLLLNSNLILHLALSLYNFEK
jgi:hypothetical protein